MKWCCNAVIGWLALGLGVVAFAGGSGLNVVVVVNQSSTNSVQLGNYYCEQRGVPPQNVLRINWPGSRTDWSRAELDAVLRTPLNAMLASRQLTNQVDYVVLSMDLPYRVNEATGVPETSGYNGTTAALFYGFKADGCSTNCPADLPSCNLAAGTASAYAASEGIFRQTPPISATSNSWLTIMLTTSNLAEAKSLVDQGVGSDGSFPPQPVVLAKSFDVNRNVRYERFDDAIFNARLQGDLLLRATNATSPSGLGTLLGFQTGVSSFTAGTNIFVPGAMADNLTSYSGDLFGTPEQTGVMALLNAGATASHGTVVEPCNYLEKFAVAQNYFYQARGFSIAECYYQSLANPYQGILVGEPLAVPFALPAAGTWSGLPNDALLAGTTNLSLQFAAADQEHPVQQVDLFVDGRYSHTLTNIPPRANNVLAVTINGFSTNYVVPANASLRSIASNLTLRLNATAYSNATKVVAVTFGDRIELRSMNLTVPGSNVTVTVSNHIGAATALTSRLHASRTNLLDTIASGRRKFAFVGQLVVGDYLRVTITKTNGLVVNVAVTNQSPTATFEIFAESFINAVNVEPLLQSSDGVVAEDLVTGPYGPDLFAQFHLRARALGIRPAQIQADLDGSFSLFPEPLARLDENLSDLQPRNHLYVTAGLTNLNFEAPFNTTTNADGYHELTAVAYEGSHVRTQKRISQNIRIQNNGWSATLTALMGDTNTALEATLQFAVAATTNNITQIELFSTGGTLGVSNNVTSTTFAVPAAHLGIGRHPFYAVVTRSDGRQYRTRMLWLRIVGTEAPFPVSVLDAAPTLAWPATAGRSYQILSATNVTNGFILRGGLTPTNSIGLWAETNNSAPQRFYRVKTP
jgi:uncharacterized protein (TIGR03790 family)